MPNTNTTNVSKKGSLRLLTLGEIALAKTVFRSTIEYHKVWIHHDSFLPFDLQRANASMTPNGELYFKHWYQDDFSLASDDMQHLFIHEMSHVWQRDRGMCVICRGVASWLVSYRYHLDGRLLSEYPMEQQAQIIADDFILQHKGYVVWDRFRKLNHPIVTLDGDYAESIILPQYKNALKGFPW